MRLNPCPPDMDLNMTTGSHETLVYRLAQILIKLNQGDTLDPRALADEFGVNLRTIQRDLNQRFAYLPLIKSDGRYHLDPCFLGKLNTRDIQRFASLAGVNGLFPSLSNEFLQDIFDSRLQSALLVKGHNYESLAGKEEQFRQLEQSIVAHHHISFDYSKNEGKKHYKVIAPYKLLNHKGIWYLVGYDTDRIKTFAFAKISNLGQHDTQFTPDGAVEKAIREEDGIWLGNDKTEVVLKVDKKVAGYFKRRKLIVNQVIEKDLEDGGLILSAKVGHLDQVLPIVRYWIPHLRIISPEGLQRVLEEELRDYLVPRFEVDH